MNKIPFNTPVSLAEALSARQHAVKRNPNSADAHLQLAVVLRSLKRYDEALRHCRNAIRLAPQSAPAYAQLGEISMSLGNFADADAAYRACISLDARLPVAHQRLGWLAYRRKDLSEAIACYLTALAIDDKNSSLHLDLGMALMESGRLDEAQGAISNAVSLRPHDPDLYFHLSRCHIRNKQLDLATRCLEQAVQVGGATAALRFKAGSAIRFLGNNDAARRQLQSIDAKQAEYPNAQTLLGTMALSEGQTGDALEHYRNGLRFNPAFSPARTGLLLTLNYTAGVSADVIFREHVEFDAVHAQGLTRKKTREFNVNSENARLRIGYVSGDFKKHSIAYFADTILQHHDHQAFELYGYSNTATEDAVTQRLKGHFDHWRNIRPLDDDQAAELIAADEIDILVDLSGHTADNRLLVFARKPAPIQVTWLGYPNTTGLRAMDYRLTDAYAEPEGMSEQYNVEKLWRLPDVFCCYTPCADKPERRASSDLNVQPTPALKNGFVTFGSFNNLAKMSPPVVALWARLLREVPGTRLMLEAAGLDSDSQRKHVAERFAVHGVHTDQLILLGRTPAQQYVLYNEVDIALDPFPCNGGTTSFDTLWMGVPLVTLTGHTFVSRMGVSLLSNLGLTDLIAQTEDQYIAIAKGLAADVSSLNERRLGLRPRMEASALLDPTRFTRNMEAAFREMWAIACVT